MLENAVVPRAHLKNIKDIAEKLNTYSGFTFSYDYCQQLFKLDTQICAQSNRDNLPRAAWKTHNHDLISELTKIYNLSDETCIIDHLLIFA